MAIRMIPITIQLAQGAKVGDAFFKIASAEAAPLRQLAAGDTLALQISKPGALEIVLYEAGTPLTPDAYGLITLPVRRGALGTTARAWPKSTCFETACCNEELQQQALEEAPWLRAFVNESIALQVPTLLPSLVDAAVTRMLPTDVASRVIAVAQSALPPMVTTEVQRQLGPTVTSSVRTLLPGLINEEVSTAATSYLAANLGARVSALMRDNPCCQSCEEPSVFVPLCPNQAVGGQQFEGVIRLENTTDVRFLNLPTWMVPSFNAETGVIRLSGVAVETARIALLMNLTNACGGNTTYTLDVVGGDLYVSPSAAQPSCPYPRVLNQLSPTSAQVGRPYTGTLRVQDATGITLEGLPSWATAAIALATGVVTITGTPPATEDFVVAVTAINTCGQGKLPSTAAGLLGGHIAVTVQPVAPPPVVTQLLTPTSIVANQTYTGTITLTNATSASVSNLPVWASQTVAYANGGAVITITGVPPAAQTYSPVVDALNAQAGFATNGLDDAAAGVLTVGSQTQCPIPSITQVLTPPSVQVNSPYVGVARFSNATAVTLSGVPPWATASVDQANGTINITGTPPTTGAININVGMQNACLGGIQTQVSGVPIGSLSVNALPNCATPYVSQQITPTNAQQFVPYQGVITVSDTTQAQINGLPTWLGQSVAYSGTTATITLTGTPPTTTSLQFNVSASNACPGGTPRNVSNASAGVLAICAAPVAGDTLVRCGTATSVGSLLTPAACDQQIYHELKNCQGQLLGYASPVANDRYTERLVDCTGATLGYILP